MTFAGPHFGHCRATEHQRGRRLSQFDRHREAAGGLILGNARSQSDPTEPIPAPTAKASYTVGRRARLDARAIAETGGSVGVWHFFPSIDRYAEGLKEMAEIVGVDHVSIGTDQFDARGCVEDYTRWVHLVAAMLRGGFTPEEAGKIAGGNYLRIFRAAVG